MSEKIIVPELGESITEATVSKWLKNKGEQVIADESIVELETDKVNLEVPAPIDGILTEINSKDGDSVKVGSILGIISESKVKTSNVKNKEIGKIQNLEETENIINSDTKKSLGSNNEEDPLVLTEEVPLVLNEEIKEIKDTSNKTLSPSVRKIVSENKINIDQVKGTGKDGRILKGDLISLMGSSPEPNQRKIQYGEEERIKMSRLRLTIAKRLKEAQENAAMLTTFNEVDMSRIINMRKENQEDFQNRYGIKLGFMSFFVKASIVGLKLFPIINSEIEGE